MLSCSLLANVRSTSSHLSLKMERQKSRKSKRMLSVTADILACDNGKRTGGANNINNSCIYLVLSVPVPCLVLHYGSPFELSLHLSFSWKHLICFIVLDPVNSTTTFKKKNVVHKNTNLYTTK